MCIYECQIDEQCNDCTYQKLYIFSKWTFILRLRKYIINTKNTINVRKDW